MKAQPHNFFLLRRPLLPLETLFDFQKSVGDNPAIFENEILKIFSKPIIMEALFLASPNLHDSLLQFLEGNYQSGQFKLCQSLYKYLIRMCSRCTPFGLFAGNVVGEVSDYTRIEFKEKSLEPCYSLDSTVLFSLRSHMSTADHIRNQILFYPNSSLYLSNGSFRYLERPNFPDSNFILVEAEANQYLNEILELSRNGIRIEQLLKTLSERGICPEDANPFVDSIVNAQILVSELDVTATGSTQLKSLIKSLEGLKNCEEDVSRLKQIQLALSNESFSASKSNEIKNLLSTNSLKLDSNKIVKADLRVNTECCSIGQAAIEIIKNELDDLSVLTEDQRNEELYKFGKDFFRKFKIKKCPY